MPIFFFSYTIQDADRDQSVTGFEFVPDTPISSDDLLSIGESIWGAVAPLINGQRVAMGISVFIRTYSGTADVSSDVEERAFFSFQDDEGNHSENAIPCFREDLFTGGGRDKTVDLTNADVLTFTTLMTEGLDLGGGGTLYHVTMHGTRVTRLRKAVQDWNTRRKRKR